LRTRVISDEDYKSLSPSMCIFLQSPILHSKFDQIYPARPPLLHHPQPSLIVRHNASQPYKSSKIIFMFQISDVMIKYSGPSGRKHSPNLIFLYFPCT
jgi:hypothetical protein